MSFFVFSFVSLSSITFWLLLVLCTIDSSVIYLQVVLLECLRKEAMLPKDVLSHFNTAFAYAKQGRVLKTLKEFS